MPGVKTAKPARKIRSNQPSGTQAMIAKGATPVVVTRPTQAMIVEFLSVCASTREERVMPHQVAAEASASTMPSIETVVPGRSITATPMKPAMVPAQRQRSTFSPSTGPASSVVNITLVNESTVAVARSSGPKEA